jgi:hypothetical protein
MSEFLLHLEKQQVDSVMIWHSVNNYHHWLHLLPAFGGQQGQALTDFLSQVFQ